MLRYIYSIFILFLFWQCQSDNIVTPSVNTSAKATLNQEFTLEQGEYVQIISSDVADKLILKLQNLNDSRCPANAYCIQYGNATASLLITDSKGLEHSLELCIGGCNNSPIRDTHTVPKQIGSISYNFTLKEINPFPGLGRKGDKKKAVLVVERAP